MKIPTDKIVVPDERARARYTDEQRDYLRASLGKYGQLSEILVRPLTDGTYELIDGESRLTQLLEAGASEVDVKSLELDDRDASMVNLLMNVARGDQDPMGVALVLGKARETGMIEEDLAAATGHTVEWVKFMLELRRLPEIYQEALKRGDLLVTHIRQAVRLPNPKEVDAALGAACRFGWNTSVMKNYVENRLVEFMAAAAMTKRSGVDVPPAALDPIKLAKYSQCLCCGEMVEKERLSLPRLCDECYQFSRYAVSQTGKGEEGMQKLFKALEIQQAYETHQRQFLRAEDLRRSPPVERPTERPTETPIDDGEGPIVKPPEMSPEAWGRIKKIVRDSQP